MIKTCVVTSARSEYGLMRWLMADISADPEMELQTVVTGMHLSPAFGSTVKEIEADGFQVQAKVETLLSSDSGVGATKSVGVGAVGLADAFERLSPDLVLVMGDRFELLGVLSACVCMGIPMGHISGGEITEGAIDDQIRHAMTKASHLHFVANEPFALRVIQMGEEPWRICVSGEPGLENIHRLPVLDRPALEADLGLSLNRPTALVTYHPVTRQPEDLERQADHLFRALGQTDLQFVITYPNADPGHQLIIDRIQRFSQDHPHPVCVRRSLGQQRYLSLLKHVKLMIGNSSSGLVEAPSYNLPAVNVGDRQKGRPTAENVFSCEPEAAAITAAIERALFYSSPACHNPFGDGHAAEKVISHIKETFQEHGKGGILRKQFVDLRR